MILLKERGIVYPAQIKGCSLAKLSKDKGINQKLVDGIDASEFNLFHWALANDNLPLVQQLIGWKHDQMQINTCISGLEQLSIQYKNRDGS